jgi:DNA polymerase/3'-5' exonuclease PolX
MVRPDSELDVTVLILLFRTGSKMFERDLRLWAKQKKQVISVIHSLNDHSNIRVVEDSNSTVLECTHSFPKDQLDSNHIHRTRRRDSKLYFPKSEREIFRLLGLEWVDPRFRNADA